MSVAILGEDYSSPYDLLSNTTRYFFQLPLDCSGEIRSIKICFVSSSVRDLDYTILTYTIYDQVDSAFTEVRSFSLTLQQALNEGQLICARIDNGLLCCPKVTLSEQLLYTSSTFLSVDIEDTSSVQLIMSNFTTNVTVCDSTFEVEDLSSSECDTSTQNFPFIFRLRIEPGNNII